MYTDYGQAALEIVIVNITLRAFVLQVANDFLEQLDPELSKQQQDTAVRGMDNRSQMVGPPLAPDRPHVAKSKEGRSDKTVMPLMRAKAKDKGTQSNETACGLRFSKEQATNVRPDSCTLKASGDRAKAACVPDERVHVMLVPLRPPSQYGSISQPVSLFSHLNENIFGIF